MQTEPEINWRVLRDIIRQDMATYQGILVSHPEYHSSTKARVEGKIAAYQGVLDSMNTLEHGAASTRALIAARQVPGLAEHTQAACDTITKAAQ